MFSWSQYSNSNPAVVLSPMSGYTDSAFKQLVRSVCPKTVVVTEFLSVDALFFKSKKTLQMMAIDESEHPVILQVFGKVPERFVHAAKLAEQMGYDGIDINMGCPAKKVIRSDHGSALVKISNRCTAMSIVSEMAKAVKIPVSVKTRIGWENSDDLVNFCKELEKNGCASLAIHGRTTKQAYLGKANWDPIYEVKKHVSIPVMGNGDITSVSAFREKLGNLDGVFIGRASFGDPWIFRDIQEYIQEYHQRGLEAPVQRLEPPMGVSSMEPPMGAVRMEPPMGAVSDEELEARFPRAGKIAWAVKKPVIELHAELLSKTKGEQVAMLEIRKHLAAYIKGIDGASQIRARLMQVKSLEEVRGILEEVKD